jgi:hypothetical protein
MFQITRRKDEYDAKEDKSITLMMIRFGAVLSKASATAETMMRKKS